ncbi:flagellar biosynthetic protein FliQ [Andreesenia angusta]|uniref:Flagellar biosynthetic protein FliQ n=1 Tax=Andreesenia angusta TaxID=39480 RepID=A0A1S1V845_9FIRM|nr:flagellar biosynthesis protein FliQ [Andreesenia angusta]OHW62773.1 flagellar biosynthetic protein FliQ [Andreesenia angusta]
MTQGDVLFIAKDALMLILITSAPMLGIALVVGITISIFQSVTQIQEATLAFVPKIVAVFVTMLIFGPWMLKMITEFTQNLFQSMNNFIG